MSQIHDIGDVWHIGWDWHAGMWFVEPPFDVDLDEPMKWFHGRDKAFAFVDKWIREMPVDYAENGESTFVGEQTYEVPTVIRHEDNPVPQDTSIPPALLKARAAREAMEARKAEPKPPVRVFTSPSAAQRVADYESRVGIRR